MRKFLVFITLALSLSAYAQEEYQETDYNIPQSEDEQQQLERGVAGNVENQGMEQVEPAAPEEVEPNYDYSAE